MQIQTLVAWAVVMAGATVQGMTGIGFGLVSVPVLILFLNPKSAVVITLMLSAVLNTLILLQARQHITLKDSGPITLGCMLGVPFGSHLLAVVSPDALKGFVSALVILVSIPMGLGYSRALRRPRATALATGVVSGLLQGSTSIGGPPVALFMTNQGIPKELFRGTMALRSVAGSTLSVLALVPAGLVTHDVAAQSLLMAPALLIGFAVGNRLLGRVPQASFKRLILLLVAGTAVLSLVSTVV